MHTRHWVPVKALWQGQRGARQSGETGSGQAALVRLAKCSLHLSSPRPDGVRSPKWTPSARIRAYAPPFSNCRFTAPAPEQNELIERARVSICFFRVWNLWVADMDAWCEELNAGLARAFRDDDECEDFEE